ncbi:Pkinase-domain-containing protein [Zopfia rhizophila CBS 207.26]|uniref:non-specific serine/threonine protein kinase n=1 Tax=Zopfia rhizophila CBS 207.26 TaxID=1314779 RepID=A0A6A6E0H5_9PEZI|nr:Pkinase-domain-containing protein [Zopfia rhizophila CBS 207.26]
MPLVATIAPNMATNFKTDSIDGAADAEHSIRRDSRTVEYQSPIPEEDESTETASEPAEPITPTSDTSPFSHPFRHDDPVEGVQETPKWAGGSKDGKKQSRFTRRRSASTEAVPKVESDDKTVDLLATFSKPAVEGVGMKARRLSLSLPDEFVVDSCELDKEFKSSSFMPGRRGKCLGRGATAEVRIMARKGVSGGEELVAVKEFRGREKSETEDEYIKKIKSEYSIAKSLHHPNIVETVRLCTNKNRWNHVMEFCGYGELFSLVERKLFAAGPEGYYSVDDRLCFFKQLLRGVDYLHSHGIAHRDIKLENLLLDKEGHLKISDFGVAEVFSGEHPGLRVAGGECGKNMGEVRLSTPGICGSLPYIAPEVLAKQGNYDPRPLDVWSCAIVFLTMTFGGCPWQAAKPEFEYYARFKKGWDEWLPNHTDGQIFDGPDGHPKCGKLFSLINPPPIKRLLLKMLHPIPEKRITIREVISTTCIKNINCCCPDSFEDPACCIDTSKCISKRTSRMTAQKKFLHHHIPPAPEKKIAKALQHRFDMGDGW